MSDDDERTDDDEGSSPERPDHEDRTDEPAEGATEEATEESEDRAGEAATRTEVEEPPGRPGRRPVGLLAILLSIVGILASIVLAGLSLRLLFTASGTADRLMEPIEAAVDRMEERIDQTDDLVDREGVEQGEIPVLRARVDGLVDLTDLAVGSFEAIDNHPLYGVLPADMSPLGDELDGFQRSADAVDEELGTGSTVRPPASATMATEIDGMQSRVTGARQRLDSAWSSLRGWLRLGGFLGFLVSLWSLWAQRALLRRGWRGFRNQPL